MVVLAMPGNLAGRLAIETQEEACGVFELYTLVLPHHPCDVIAASQLVAEAVPVQIKQHAADAS